jgi:nucleoside-diphosphate-sugar epimerase
MEGMGQRVLVTGGAGFIGACLVRELLAAGEDVSVLLRRGSKAWRLADIQDRITIHFADLQDRDAVFVAVRATRPAVVYHTVAHGAYPFQKDRQAILTTNLLGTANLLDALDSIEFPVLVHTGSSSEYGHKDRSMREDDRLDPRSDYAVSKAAATLLCQAEAYRGRPIVTVRLFSVYGPWEEPTRLVPYLMGCCLRGEAPRVTAGWQPRDFIYVADVIGLLRTAARCPAAWGQILHAGTGRTQTVRDMVEAVVSVCGDGRMAARYGDEPVRADEPAVWVASRKHTSALTGWRPHHDLHDGVKHMWAWYTRWAGTRAA